MCAESRLPLPTFALDAPTPGDQEESAQISEAQTVPQINRSNRRQISVRGGVHMSTGDYQNYSHA